MSAEQLLAFAKNWQFLPDSFWYNGVRCRKNMVKEGRNYVVFMQDQSTGKTIVTADGEELAFKSPSPVTAVKMYAERMDNM